MTRTATTRKASPHPETLSATQLAEELGRSREWLYDNLDRLYSADKMPRPLHGGAPPLTWSRAHIIAWIDRDLEPWQKLAAVGYRAAVAAATAARLPTRGELSIAEHQAQLADRLAAAANVDPVACTRHGRMGCKSVLCTRDRDARLVDAIRDAGRAG